jgi:hypothetical protein
MQKAWLCILLITFLAFSAATVNAQSKPQLLMTPTNWRLEQYALPPEFAPNVKYHGLEELRFAPGWGNKGASDYFTLIYGLRFDDTKGVTPTEIKNYLQIYFRELCGKTAKDRGLANIDTSAITASVEKKQTTDKGKVYNVSLHIFAVFTDGAPITLNMEIKELDDRPHQKVYLHIIASPQPKTNPLWQEMYKEQREFVVPAG